MLLTTADRKVLAIAASIFALIVIAGLLLAGPGPSQLPIPTTYSSGSAGAKGIFLLLKESGFSVERWEQPATELPRADNIVLVIAEPAQLATSEERSALERFVAGGGRIVATGVAAAIMLPEGVAVPDPAAGAVWSRAEAATPSSMARDAPSIMINSAAEWSAHSAAIPLYRADGKPVVVHYAFGKGEILWLAAPTPFTNAGLKEPGNLEFVLAALGNDKRVRILWNEYVHGYRHSLAASVAHSPIQWTFVQLAIIAAGILWTYSRRSGPVRDPVAESRLSPLEFVATLGGLYERAKAGAVCVDVAYQRFRYWMTRRLGVSPAASIAELETGAAERWNFRDSRFAPTLRDCESARFNPELPPNEALHLVQTLYSFALEMRLFPQPVQEIRSWNQPPK